MKIKEIEIINLTQTEIKTIIIFLLKNKHFKTITYYGQLNELKAKCVLCENKSNPM